MEGHHHVMLWIMITTCFWSNSIMCTTFVNTMITGPNGYCLGVDEYLDYNDQNVAIYECHDEWEDRGSRILWTFESDGTLRSDGKCLATNENFTEGSYLLIRDCDAVARNRTIWQLPQDSNNGVILNPTSGLVVSRISGVVDSTYVTLTTNIFSSFQTWRVGNDTERSPVYITGLRGNCLHFSDNNYSVWVANCEVSTNLAQQWLLFSDGTIRPQRNSNWCLSYDNLINDRVVVMTCGNGPTSQRWLFTQNGTISNQRDNLVVDVKSSNPSLKEIIVYSANGGANQKWQYFPISY